MCQISLGPLKILVQRNILQVNDCYQMNVLKVLLYGSCCWYYWCRSSLSIGVCHRNQPNKSKLVLHNSLLLFLKLFKTVIYK